MTFMQFGERLLRGSTLYDEMLETFSGLYSCRKQIAVSLLMHSGIFIAKLYNNLKFNSYTYALTGLAIASYACTV